jgi:hypothetical protein
MPIGVIMAFNNTLIIALGDLATQRVVQACSSPYSFGSLVGLALSIVPRVDTRALGSMPVGFPLYYHPFFLSLSKARMGSVLTMVL